MHSRADRLSCANQHSRRLAGCAVARPPAAAVAIAAAVLDDWPCGCRSRLRGKRLSILAHRNNEVNALSDETRQNRNDQPQHVDELQLEAAHYFDQLEADIIKRLHREAETAQSRCELLHSTGAHDSDLVDELSRLGITAHEVIILRFLPLVLVAWAEDVADPKEQKVVTGYAERLGVKEDSTAWIVLDTWLRGRPPGLTVDAWKRYTRNILAKVSAKNAERLIELTRRQMTDVAKASGGHLGFGKVSRKERTMIDRMVAIMRQQAKLAERMQRRSDPGEAEPVAPKE